MPNVSHEVAEQGWAFYISQFPRPSWEGVNAYLAAKGLPAIGKRTHDFEQFSGRNRGFTVSRLVDRCARNHFNFEIGSG